jgi:hypothetical protein
MLGVFFTIYFIVISKDQTLLKESEAAVQIDVQSLQNIYDLAGIDELISTLESRVIDPTNNSFYALKNNREQL